MRKKSFLLIQKMSVIATFIFLLLLSPGILHAQQVIKLYPGAIPSAKSSDLTESDTDVTTGMFREVITPTLEMFAPEKDKATGAAVVICPGGGYSVLVYEGEGVTTAREFANNGVTAFVLKYRLPRDATMENKTIGPLQDAQQAIKVVRENADKWGIDKDKIGIMGFSAGGHLASTAATHFEEALIPNENNTSLRPDFQILIYPVISMQDSLTHGGSRNNLLGGAPPQELTDEYSNELQVAPNSPPAYITHAGDDELVVVDNSIDYYESLQHHKVPAELHLYPRGGHGFVLAEPTGEWMAPIFKWMTNSEWMGN
ncbi:alpha/beta hydrolase [Aliifodinibius salicampi]|uniref:Alpha/beta hydrolase n=1 Tax=Fodinibius salicampi TaxID=1920655 RepID=A0ABT3PZR1_9BACT|nr:alpha/beta hydrolase [Fodinibius salicampi]MCW9713315.1 alpha/beta hydrolase [Fodinibius salicampi]